MNMRYYTLDAFRFVLAALVVVYHYVHLSPEFTYIPEQHSESWYYSLISLGYLAVQVFFVISGYVILGSVWRRTETQSALITFRTFWKNRVIRLIPALTITSFFGYIASLLLPIPTLHTYTLIESLINATGVLLIPIIGSHLPWQTIDGALWSLRYEVGFYILVSLIASAQQLHRLPYILVGWATFIITCTYTQLRDIVPGLYHILADQYAVFFMAGMSLFLIRTETEFTHRIRTLLKILYAVTIGAGGLQVYRQLASFNESGFNATPAYLGVLFFALLIAVFHVTLRGHALNERASQICMILGGTSYTLYVLHQWLGYRLITYLHISEPIGIAALFVCMAVCSIGLHLIWEKPLMGYMKKKLG